RVLRRLGAGSAAGRVLTYVITLLLPLRLPGELTGSGCGRCPTAGLLPGHHAGRKPSSSLADSPLEDRGPGLARHCLPVGPRLSGRLSWASAETRRWPAAVTIVVAEERNRPGLTLVKPAR